MRKAERIALSTAVVMTLLAFVAFILVAIYSSGPREIAGKYAFWGFSVGIWVGWLINNGR
jgi:hypothetical protein